MRESLRRLVALLTAIALVGCNPSGPTANPSGQGTGITDKQEPKEQSPADVREAFGRFAAAVKGDEYNEAARWIAPPADKVWTNFAAAWSAASKYEAALEGRFGKSEDGPVFWGPPKQGELAEQFWEARGEIREVKEIGNGRALLRVWTKRPDRRKPSETALYERTFTAVKVEDQWKFQLHSPAQGSPVLKAVKRTGADGKEVEVYAEHDPKGQADETKWEELKPISYEGDEEDLKQYAAELAELPEVLRVQTELVQKGTYKTREEAREALRKVSPRR
jgi:hypothetical protein